MRKYRLHGSPPACFAGRTFHLEKCRESRPRARGEKRGGFCQRKGLGVGFVNLLRRSIAPRDLLATCFAEWKKSAAPAGKISTTRLQQAEEIFGWKIPGRTGTAIPSQPTKAFPTHSDPNKKL